MKTMPIRHRVARLALAAMLAITALGTALNVRAQEGKKIAYDTPVEGKLDDAAITETWELTAPGKDKISILVQRTDGTLVPSVQLQDANGQQLYSDSGYDAGDKAEIVDYSLPAAGTYKVVVGRLNEKNGKTIGAYKLTVSLDSAGEDNPSMAKAEAKPIEYDKPVESELTNAKWLEAWTFNAPADDVIAVSVVRTAGTLRPVLDLLDSNGASQTQGYVERDGTNAAIESYSLKASGQYTVVVKRENERNGGTVGKYKLTLRLVGAGPSRAELKTPVGPAKIDGVMAGEITALKWMNVYTFETQSADRMRFSVTRTDGTLIPRMTLLGGNSQEITSVYPDNTQASAATTYNLPGPGKYSVVVLRDGEEKGPTTGKYELTITLLGVGENNPIFKTSAGTLTLGTPAKGVLNGAKWQDSWTVQVPDKAKFSISAKRTSGTLFPVIEIVGANNNIVTTINPDETYSEATRKDFTFPGSGAYTIVVKRQGEVSGQTAGAYELLIVEVK